MMRAFREHMRETVPCSGWELHAMTQAAFWFGIILGWLS